MLASQVFFLRSDDNAHSLFIYKVFTLAGSVWHSVYSGSERFARFVKLSITVKDYTHHG